MCVSFMKLKDSEYDCGLCKETHSYYRDDDYQSHQEFMIGPKRWIYEEVKDDNT